LTGDLNLRALGTYVAELASNDGVTSIDTAGNLSSAQPYWTWNFSAGYSVGDFSTTVEVSRIGGGKYDKNFGPLDFDRNDVEAVNYINLSADYVLKIAGANYQTYFAINNLTNEEPPVQFSNGGGAYDRLGRAYRVGLRFKY
jgi:outer membrane receptor protein involved in Fe transport